MMVPALRTTVVIGGHDCFPCSNVSGVFPCGDMFVLIVSLPSAFGLFFFTHDVQALQSGDESLLEQCLSVGEQGVIEATVERLPSSKVLQFLLRSVLCTGVRKILCRCAWDVCCRLKVSTLLADVKYSARGVRLSPQESSCTCLLKRASRVKKTKNLWVC